MATPWWTEGPSLPIEFARVGNRGELATVLCPGRCPVSPVRWAELNEADLVKARKLLRQREEIPASRVDGVGSVRVGQPPGYLLGATAILRWASAKKGIDAVIWTSLPPRFGGSEGRVPTP